MIVVILVTFFIANLSKNSKKEKYIDLTLIVLLLIFFRLFFRCDLISIYTSYAVDVLVILNWIFITRSNKRLFTINDGIAKWLRFSIAIPIIVLNQFLIQGCFPDKTVVFDFVSPLKNGKYYVLQGGTPPLMNRAHYRNNKQDRYSLDIVRLNKKGLSKKKLFPKTVNDYNIYADSVFSPCNGKVVEVIQETECNYNLTKTKFYYDNKHLTNNIVIISTEDAKLILAHLKKGSIIVEKGQLIKQSDFIGLVSNAGAVEPHLHMQLIKDGLAEPFLINGKYLHNNSILRN